MKDNLLKEIVKNEWDFFHNVNNIGNRSFCQDDINTFIYARVCYWSIYNEDILKSYLEDLKDAKSKGRNIVTEKYAYMMEKTDNEYFQKIKHRLPALSKQKLEDINNIISIQYTWEKEILDNKSYLYDNMRKLDADSKHNTSAITYFTGELKSYSDKTISLIKNYFIQANNRGINLLERNLKNLKG